MTWTYLSDLPDSEFELAPEPLAASLPLGLAPISPPTLSRVPVAAEAVSAEDISRPAARWEMMVPKMDRPLGRQLASASAAAAPALAAQATPTLEPPTAEPAAPTDPTPIHPSAAQISETPVPSFALNAPEQRSLTRYWPQVVFVVLAISLLGYMAWEFSSRTSSAITAATTSPVKAANWSYQPVALAGRSLSIYEPSRGQSDFRIEFSWIPDAAGVGWLFRTRDGNNYYAARLSLQQKGGKSLLLAEHFSVLSGKESAHSRKLIPLERAAALIRVHMDAVGPVFKLFIENDPADNWNDSRLAVGALGFYKDGPRLPKLLAISFTFIKNSASRTALVSLP